jgi:dTDP-4-amino-4,6-dideoxygalactose transaminase
MIERNQAVVTAPITSIPLLDLKGQFASLRAEIGEAVDRVLDTQHFILGPEVEALEREIADYSHCRFGIGVSSGTDALLVSLMALDLQPGDEVITTPYTFFATAGSIQRLGARPVFVDIDPKTYNLDPSKVEAAITARTRVILPVHLYGQMADMNPLLSIAKQHNLAVVEDAAQAIGAEYEGRRAGSLGHLGCLSFFPSKNLGGYGDGGMVVCNDPDLADRVRLLRAHGARPKYHHKIVGGNFRLDALQAAVLRVKLKYLDQWTAARQRNAALYRIAFEKAGLSNDRLYGQPVGLPYVNENGRHVYNQFVIRAPDRDRLMAHLKQHQIGCEVYYPVPMHMQECFHTLHYRAGDFPTSECAAAETLALPIYPELSAEMIQHVVNVIATFYEVKRTQ